MFQVWGLGFGVWGLGFGARGQGILLLWREVRHPRESPPATCRLRILHQGDSQLLDNQRQTFVHQNDFRTHGTTFRQERDQPFLTDSFDKVVWQESIIIQTRQRMHHT